MLRVSCSACAQTNSGYFSWHCIVQAQTPSRSADSVKLVRNTSSNSHNMDAAGIEVTPFGMLSHFHTKSNGDNLNVDSKELVTAVAAAAAATTATAAKAPSDSRRALKKGMDTYL
jgi:hypothetical protein